MKECLNNPMILAAMAVITVAMFRLSLVLRKNPFPQPQLVLALTLSIFADLLGRLSSAFWLQTAEIAMFWVWGATIVGSVFANIHRLAVEAKRPGAAIWESNFFDRWQIQLTWGLGIIIGGILLFGWTNDYQAQLVADRLADRRVKQALVQAKREQAVRDSVMAASTRAYRDSLTNALMSLQAMSQKTLVNQNKILKGQVAGQRQREKIAAQVVKAQAVVERNERRQNKVNNLEPAKPKPKPKWWEKINPFGRHEQPDSLIYVLNTDQ